MTTSIVTGTVLKVIAPGPAAGHRFGGIVDDFRHGLDEAVECRTRETVCICFRAWPLNSAR